MNNNTNRYYWFFQIGGWSFYILLYGFLFYTLGARSSEMYYALVFEAVLGFLVTHLMRYLLKETRILQQPMAKQAFWLGVITVIFGMLYSTMVLAVEHQLGWEPENFREAPYLQKWVRTTFGSLLYFTIWSLFYFAYHYVSSTQQQRMNSVKLEAMVKELELKTIKAHINPHFIFNALNSIRALVDENPQRARNAITELSQLLRSSMNAEKEELVSLSKELAIVKNYLALEQIRFEERLKVSFEIDADTLQQMVPPMMLQTLVENGIKHGISKQIKGGDIIIQSFFEDDNHVLRVVNSGQMLIGENEGGFGLASTRNRLQLLYGSKAWFTIKQLNEQQVEATVVMPVNVPLAISN